MRVGLAAPDKEVSPAIQDVLVLTILIKGPLHEFFGFNWLYRKNPSELLIDYTTIIDFGVEFVQINKV
jgi:hypothetical protein